MDASAYSGTCTLKHVGPDLYVEHADPRIRIAGKVIDDIAIGDSHPAVTIDGPVIKIRAVNRTVIYRIVGQLVEPCREHDGTYAAEFPD